MSNENILTAARWLSRSSCTTVLCGAGLSKASGIPTYRCADNGLWTHPDNEKYSHIDGVRKDPVGARAFWDERKGLMATVAPNAGHHAMREMQVRYAAANRPLNLVTQNVDGLLQDAGCSGVIELHGSLRRFSCLDHPEHKSSDDSAPCPHCGNAAKLRPDIVLFGEKLEGDTLFAAFEAADQTDVLLIVGTSIEVFPAALMAPMAAAKGARIIYLDPNPAEITSAFEKVEIRMPAEVALPAIVSALSLS